MEVRPCWGWTWTSIAVVVRLPCVQDTTPAYEGSDERLVLDGDDLQLKGDVFKWKEVDPEKADSGVSDEMLRELKKPGAVHIFMGEAALATALRPGPLYNLSWSWWAGTRSSNRLMLRRY